MEKTNDVSEQIKGVEDPLLVKSMEKDVLVSDISGTTKELEDEGEMFVMVGAEVADSTNEIAKEPRKGSGLVSIPTILEKELHELLTNNSPGTQLEVSDGTLKKDGNGDEKAVLPEKVEDCVDMKEKKFGFDAEKKEKTEKDDGSEGDKTKKEKEEKKDDESEKKEKKEKKEKGEDSDKKEKKEKKEKGGDSDKKEKKEKKEKDKNSADGKRDKEKVKSDKEGKEKEKKEKKEKKSKKSNVEKIQKKLEKIHAKMDRILAKKEEYLQRLVEAQEKDRQEKERLAAENSAKQKGESLTTVSSSIDRHGDASTGGDVREAEVKQVEPPVHMSAKQLNEEMPSPLSAPQEDTSNKDTKLPEEKSLQKEVISEQSKKEQVEDVKHTSDSVAGHNNGESGALSFSA